ncbi:MAG: thioredoxin [Clostridia bacterium]|nr:thioredoxin [Clostridia bacterium]
MAEITITKNNFESEVLNSDIPVLVDFWATWCGPCKMIAPIVEEIANEYEGKIKVGKINVDDEQELAIKYGVMSIPTIILFKNGSIADTSVGYVPKEKLVEMISK